MVTDGPELRSFLTSIAIFGGLMDPTLDRVIGMLEEHHPAVGTTVCREGETGVSMYIVRDGEVVVSRRAESGTSKRMVRMGPGEFFGEMTLIDIQPRSATVTVEAPTTLYSLTNRDLYKLYREDSDGYVMVIQNICRELSRRLRSADRVLTNYADDAGDEDTLIKQRPAFLPTRG